MHKENDIRAYSTQWWVPRYWGAVLFPPWAWRFYSTRSPSACSPSPGNVHSAFCGAVVSSFFPSQLQGLLTSGVSHCCRPSRHVFPLKAMSPLVVRLVLMEWALCFSLMCAQVWEDQKIREGEVPGMAQGRYPCVCEVRATWLSGLVALRRKAQRKVFCFIFKHKMETLYWSHRTLSPQDRISPWEQTRLVSREVLIECAEVMGRLWGHLCPFESFISKQNCF